MCVFGVGRLFAGGRRWGRRMKRLGRIGAQREAALLTLPLHLAKRAMALLHW